MKKTLALICSIVFLFAAFALPIAAEPPWPTQEFAVGARIPLRKALALEAYCVRDAISDGNVFTDSVLVLHKGEIVYERHARGWDADTKHQMYSVTKSVLSALVGVAIGDGKIQSVEQKVIEFFDDLVIPAGQEAKNDITIEHLLRQTSGLPGDGDRESEAVEWWAAEDSGKACFLFPQMAAPGERFAYSSAAGMQTLTALLTKAVGGDLFDYAKEKLFGPLGMSSVTWDAAADGVYYGGFGFSMSPRDMARLGYLYLNNGNWDGQQIIPAEYVAASAPPAGANYGYLFWGFSDKEGYENAYGANGAFGQRIWILPGQDAVIVRTGSAGPLTTAVRNGAQRSDLVLWLFMNVVYPLVPLKGVPLPYFMETLGT